MTPSWRVRGDPENIARLTDRPLRVIPTKHVGGHLRYVSHPACPLPPNKRMNRKPFFPEPNPLSTRMRATEYIVFFFVRALFRWRGRSSRKDGCTFAKWETWPNSLLAHRLQKFAEAAGKGDQVHLAGVLLFGGNPGAVPQLC